jgi:hypothetical protein
MGPHADSYRADGTSREKHIFTIACGVNYFIADRAWDEELTSVSTF